MSPSLAEGERTWIHVIFSGLYKVPLIRDVTRLPQEPFLLAPPRPLQRQVWELCEKLGHLQQRLHLRGQAEKRTAQLENIPTCCVIIYIVKGSGCRKIWGVEIKLQMIDNLFTKESYAGLFIIGSLGFYNKLQACIMIMMVVNNDYALGHFTTTSPLQVQYANIKQQKFQCQVQSYSLCF